MESIPSLSTQCLLYPFTDREELNYTAFMTRTFQQTVMQLTQFWMQEGCLLGQGHDVEVGAGTFNPATFLRSLGPEPFGAVYVEPSRRPQDGRFGDNPNRLQLFHQLQVIIKPPPKDIQSLYIKSLEVIGFNLKEHDLRFVHDDWESPTLGASGLGWEVWLDGMEVTQFTYFQTVAGFSLDPITVELTYGLERLAMILQKTKSFFEMKWNEKVSYGDLFHRSEVEWSHYNFNQAQIEMWLRHFEDFEKEASQLIQINLPLPAYDFVMKASHAFNILEARGVLSVTERMGYIRRIRSLAHLTAEKYIKSRESLAFPLLKEEVKEEKPQKKGQKNPSFDSSKFKDFLLEIGSEELPATFVPIGIKSLKKEVETLLKTYQLSYEKITFYATPRRLSILVEKLSEGTQTETVIKKGPAIETAFDTNGTLSKQGEGFFKSIDIPFPASLSEVKEKKCKEVNIQTIKGRDFLIASKEKQGQATAAILERELPNLILNLNFPKKMHWEKTKAHYPRPLRWMVALFGHEVIPFDCASISSGRMTYGHRQLSPQSIEIKEASHYEKELMKVHVIASAEKRKDVILKELSAIEKRENLTVLEKNTVLKQVLFLSEWPELILGHFKSEFLSIPEEILTSEMIEHQKYFPLLTDKKTLSNAFVITADNSPSETIVKGNEAVLSARLADGAFLYQEDLKTTLNAFSEKLSMVTLQKDLGTLAEKRDRLQSLVKELTELLGMEQYKAQVERAAYLSKADLSTELVQEFPNLQGVIGKYYALHQKEDIQVALAIEEHWYPKSEEKKEIPTTEIGALLSLADKCDHLTSYFSAGLKPSASSDPYALRRQAIGIIRLLIEKKWDFNLAPFLKKVESLLKNPLEKSGVVEEVITFLKNRLKIFLFESFDFKKDEIEATFQKNEANPYDQYLKVKALHTFRESKEFSMLLEVFKRAKGQIDKQPLYTVNPSLFETSSEKDLFHALEKSKGPIQQSIQEKNYETAFITLSKIQAPLATLFDEVKILADKEDIKRNRIALLQALFLEFSSLIDFEKIQR